VPASRFQIGQVMLGNRISARLAKSGSNALSDIVPDQALASRIAARGWYRCCAGGWLVNFGTVI